MRTTGKALIRSAVSSALRTLASLFPAGLLTTVPAFACSMMNVEAAIVNAVAVSARYWIASILLGGVLIGLEFRQRRFWLFPTIALALLVFHPHWTLPSFFRPDCVFVNVETSQVVLAAIALMLGYRMVGHMLTQRQKVAVAAIAVGIGGVATAAAVVFVLLHIPPRNLRYVLPEVVPWLLVVGVATGFLVAVALGVTGLAKRIARG